MGRTNPVILPKLRWLRWGGAGVRKRQREDDLFNSYNYAVQAIRFTTHPRLYAKFYEFSSDLFNKTEDRIENVESRASSTLIAISAVVAFIAGIWAFLEPEFIKLGPVSGRTALLLTGLGATLVSMVCLALSLYCAWQVFGDFIKHVQGPEDLIALAYEDEDCYSFRFGCTLLEYAIKNYKVYSAKLEWLFRCQKYLQGGLILALLAVTIQGSAIVVARVWPGGTVSAASAPATRTERPLTKEPSAGVQLVPLTSGAPKALPRSKK